MNPEELSQRWSIDLNKLIKQTDEKIQALKNNVDQDPSNDLQQKEDIRSSLDFLSKTVETNHEQSTKIKQLREEFEAINETKESIDALRVQISKTSAPSNWHTHQTVELPVIQLDADYTVNEVVIDRHTPVQTIVKQAQRWPISQGATKVFELLGITDNNHNQAA